LLLDTSANGGPTEGIVVETEQAPGVWRSLATVHPRRNWSTMAVSLAGEKSVRLRFLAAHALRFAGVLEQPSAPAVLTASLLSARSGSGADWTNEARSQDGASAVVQANDTLSLSFQDVAAT